MEDDGWTTVAAVRGRGRCSTSHGSMRIKLCPYSCDGRGEEGAYTDVRERGRGCPFSCEGEGKRCPYSCEGEGKRVPIQL